MSAAAILASLRALGFVLTVAEGRIHVSPGSRLTEAQRAAIRDYKAELLALLHQEHIDERAAVLEVDHHFPRAAAEQESVRRAAIHFKLDELYGDPPRPGGGTAIGECSPDELLALLREKYGHRLILPAPTDRPN